MPLGQASLRGFIRSLLDRSRLAQVLHHQRRGYLAGRRVADGPGRGLWIESGISNTDYSSGLNELPVQRELATHLTQGSVLYDIGANVGFMSLIAARLVGEPGRVYAFEPLPANAHLLAKNVAANRLSNVEVRVEAVCAGRGKGRLFNAVHGGGASLVAPAKDSDGSTTDVDLVTLDHLVLACGLRPPTVVKVDVEGSELDVFEGMDGVIARHHPIVIFEVDDETRDAVDRKYDACAGWLSSRGYTVRRLPDSYPDIAWHVAHGVARWSG